MNTSPRGAASGPVGNSRRAGKGILRGRTATLITASIAATCLFLPTRALAQPPATIDTTHADTSAATVRATTVPVTRAASPPSTKPFTFWNYPTKARENRLPFAGHPAPRTYPEVSVGFGLGLYASSFKGVDRAFAAIEDTVRRAGYAIPASGSVPSPGLSMLTLRVSATPRLGASLQLGETNDGANDVRLAGGFAWYGWTFPQVPALSLETGAGGGLYRFLFKRSYNIVVSPVDANGGYTTLDFLQYEGRGAYATLVGEVVLRANPGVEFTGTIQYLAAGDVSEDIAGLGRQSINVSGCTLGLSFLVSF